MRVIHSYIDYELSLHIKEIREGITYWRQRNDFRTHVEFKIYADGSVDFYCSDIFTISIYLMFKGILLWNHSEINFIIKEYLISKC